VSAELLDIRDAGEQRFVLILHAHVSADWGERGPHGEVVTVRDGNVIENRRLPDRRGRTGAAWRLNAPTDASSDAFRR
jgi:hypothetical protein